MPRKDNTTLRRKVALRTALLAELPSPVVLETHGGMGRVWYRCYGAVARGAVIERDPAKAAHLAAQRPTWAVYEMDAEAALRMGAGAHLGVNLLDVDPYGEPWPVVRAFFESERPWPDRLAVAVNDGLRIRLKYGGGWQTLSIAEECRRYGNANLFDHYLEICQSLLERIAAQRGYCLTRWAGYYCPHGDMTHYGALFTRSASAGPSGPDTAGTPSGSRPPPPGPSPSPS